jgi:carbonic anhydrase/acetyltransferase-like protein (isoleucine patch superfamily)
MKKKYELIKSDIPGLYRVKALRNFSDVNKDDIGGYVESEDNLSHDGNCWISEDAQVYGNARVYGNAHVYGNAKVYGDAHVYGNARVRENSLVFRDAQVYDDTEVYGNAHVLGSARIYEDAKVSGTTWVSCYAKVYGNAKVHGVAKVYENAQVYGDAWVHGDARVSDNARVYGDAWVHGNTRVCGNNICIRTAINISGLPRDSVTVTDNHVNIGFEHHTLEHWLKHYKKILVGYGYNKDEIKLYKNLLYNLTYVTETTE